MMTANIQKPQRWPPLRERIVRTSNKNDIAGISFAMCMASVENLKPHGKTKEWTEEQMEQAIQDVTNGVLGVERAALEYQVPRSMLSDCVTGRVCPGATPSPPEYLCAEEEEGTCQVDDRLCRSRLCQKCV